MKMHLTKQLLLPIKDERLKTNDSRTCSMPVYDCICVCVCVCAMCNCVVCSYMMRVVGGTECTDVCMVCTHIACTYFICENGVWVVCWYVCTCAHRGHMFLPSPGTSLGILRSWLPNS